MILAIDIGNTNIVIGCTQREKVHFVERVSTNISKTELEYVVEFKTLFDLYRIKTQDITGCIIASVVPPLVNIVKSAMIKLLHITPLIVGPGIKTGLNILMDNPAQLGADLIVNAVAALKYYGAPAVIIDMGTATTISVVDDKKKLCGRHDPARRTDFPGRPGKPYLPAAKNQSGSAEEGHRQKYHRLHEKRYHHGPGCQHGRHDPENPGGARLQLLRGCHRRTCRLYRTLLQGKGDL